jgi:prepilin-type N-terminal cleavage/methylation domain-containing protein
MRHQASASRPGGRRDEQGFTLMELLIVIGILPIVIGAVAYVMIGSFRNEGQITTRLDDSHDAQITSTYFTRDVQAASTITTQASGPLCGNTNQLLGLSWVSNGKTVAVSYSVSTVSGVTHLVRVYCLGTNAPVTNVLSIGLFSGLGVPIITNSCAGSVSSCATSGGTTVVTVTVSCQGGGTTCANGGPISTFPSSTSPGIKSVLLDVTSHKTGYHYSLTAVPRNQASQVTEPPGSAGPPFVLLGTQNPALTCDNKNGVTVNGAVAVNLSNPGSLSFGPASSGLTATQVYTETLSPTGGVVTPSSAYTGPVVQGPVFPDPYSGLPDPTSSTVYTGGTIQGPGVYTSTVTVSGSVSLAPGIYIFEHSLDVTGTLTGNGVMLYIGIPNAPAGTKQDSGYAVTGNGVVNIVAPASGTYAGIAIFQSRSDSTAMSIVGNGGNSTYGGVLYAPAATINSNGNGSVAAGSIVAGAYGCGGNGGLSVGYGVISSAPLRAAISVGSNNADTVSIVGSPGRGAPQGTVTFYACGPSIVPGSCTSSNGTQVGAPVALTAGATDISTAQSAWQAFNTTGTSCFVVYFAGDPNYGAVSDTTTDGCFTVDGPTVTITFPVPGASYHASGKKTTWAGADPCATAQAICGTATDVGGTITKVEYSLQQTSGTGCWTGSAWTGTCPGYTTVTSVTLSGTTWTWSQSWNQSNFAQGTYLLTVRATDSNGIVSTSTAAFTIQP